MQDFFIHLSSSWGLSDKPGRKDMWIKSDGSYIVKVEYANSENKGEDYTREGIIDDTKMSEVKVLLEGTLVNSSETMITDASYNIEWKKGDEVVVVKNNIDAWKKVTDLLPEYNQD